MRKLHSLLLDVKNDTIVEVDINDELHEFYDTLGVDMIEMPCRKIDGKEFVLICDEEALLKEKPILACISKSYSGDRIYGNVLFFNDKGYGEIDSLTENDIRRIKLHIKTILDIHHPDMFHKIIEMD